MKKHVFILSLFVIVFAACSYHQGKERRNIVAPPKVHRKYESKCDEKKVVETVATQLPRTGAGENMLFAGLILSIVTFFYLRSRQLKKEVRIIRHTYNSVGTI